MKNIGIIAARSVLAKSNVPTSRIPQRLAIEIENTGKALVQIISAESPQIEKHLKMCDAVILPGGVDIDPTLYGQTNEGLSKSTYKPNDEFLIGAVNRIREYNDNKRNKKKMPLLGICKGMQIINVAHGGTLHQDLATAELHKQGDKPYEIIHDVETLSLQEQRDLLRGRLLSRKRIFGVNSLHHQGVDKLGNGLEVLARSTTDGVIEAFSDSKYITGVQRHPEHLMNGKELLKLLGL